MPTAKQLKKKSQKKRAKEAKKTLALTQIASPIVVECEAPAAAAEITDQEPRGLSACDQSLDTTTLQSVPEIISAAVIEPVKVPATAQNVCDGLCDDVNSEKISEKKPEKRSQRKRAQAAKQKAASISVSADEIKVDASEPIPIATPIDPSTDSEPAATFFSACINSVAALVDLNSKSVETVAIPVAKKSAEVPEVPLVVQTAVENLPTEQKFNETQIERAIEPISSNLDIPAPDIVENAPAAAAIVEKNDPSPECVAKNDENDDSMQPIETVDSAIDLDLDEKLGFTTPVSPVKLVETKYYDSFEEIRKTILNTDGEQQKKIKKNLKKKKAKQAAAKLTPSTETKFECKKEAVIVAEVEIVADQPEEEYATSAPQEEIDVYIPTPYVAPVVYKTNHPYLFEVEVFRSHHPDMGYYISKMLEDTSLSLANIYTEYTNSHLVLMPLISTLRAKSVKRL